MNSPKVLHRRKAVPTLSQVKLLLRGYFFLKMALSILSVGIIFGTMTTGATTAVARKSLGFSQGRF
jgi:hypothetical protein